ncbi:MAG: iron-sulfur cluster insertion protein ErpA [Rhodospirillales bacterium]|nr:iron-sulfur cluster insertion protein ErpA [Rhodospirillales bacterium]
MAADGTLSTADEITVSANAARRIAALIAAEGGGAAMKLRVSVSGGGCSGFQYGFTLDDQHHEDDRVFARDDVGVLIDEVSLGLLRGSELDFVDDLIGSYFVVKNPNATSTCGCGSSFSV